MNAYLDGRGEPTQLLLEAVRERLGLGGGGADPGRVLEAVAELAPIRGSEQLSSVSAWVGDRLTGLGPLQGLAEGPGVTDVLVLASGEVWVEDGDGLHRSALRLEDEEERRRLAMRLVALGGRRIDDARPYGDVVVGGFRVHAVLPPVSAAGTVLSVRVLGRSTASLDGLFPEPGDPWPGWLAHAVRSRLNLLISGGTGAGKTTLLSALLAACSAEDRIVIAEDAGELAPAHPHVVALQSRASNAEGRGEVSLAELIRQALRMRPDRLVVGECRGEEVRELLMALNTGHHGAAGTVHANSAADVPARLLALGALAGWNERATALQAAAALDAVVHLARDESGRRRPVAMVRLLAVDGRLLSEAIVEPDARGRPVPGPAFAWFAGHHRGGGT
ncbi:TadA family conjugal transfer-associated ATPase [Galactobacter valiniphilus]|uniref:TadA family conjugal transfer-associated ATPase n=1 Tax=Galactobacter valiniphilus TaxID=2676122 RepID=UPI00373661A9